MKKISLQWRLTLMTSLLIAASCIILNILLLKTGLFYMDSIGSSLLEYDSSDDIYIDIADSDFTDSASQLSIQMYDTKKNYGINGWIITAIITVISGCITYFISGHALKPLRAFSGQIEKIEMQNITDCAITADGVPEFKQLADSFNRMLKRLSDSFDMQRQFTGNAAHELRTPLALMQARLELYQQFPHTDDAPETEETVSMLAEQTKRLSSLVKTLLEMSELKTVQLTDKVELVPLIEEVAADLEPLADNQNIKIALDLKDNSALIGNDIFLYRLFFNIVENAIKYNRAGGTVNISSFREDKSSVILIRDTGTGIPPEYAESVFLPFFRADKSRSRALGGVGLGLALVREIADLHGGSVAITESSENGTEFRVKLPVK